MNINNMGKVILVCVILFDGYTQEEINGITKSSIPFKQIITIIPNNRHYL